MVGTGEDGHHGCAPARHHHALGQDLCAELAGRYQEGGRGADFPSCPHGMARYVFSHLTPWMWTWSGADSDGRRMDKDGVYPEHEAAKQRRVKAELAAGVDYSVPNLPVPTTMTLTSFRSLTTRTRSHGICPVNRKWRTTTPTTRPSTRPSSPSSLRRPCSSSCPLELFEQREPVLIFPHNWRLGQGDSTTHQVQMLPLACGVQVGARPQAPT